MRVLVTGGAGFIGGHLVRRLAEHARTQGLSEIVVLDNLHRACQRDALPGSVQFIESDIRNRTALGRAMREANIVFHLAAQSNVLGAASDPDYAFTTNVTGTYNVLAAAADAGVRRLVFTSSREVYGDPKIIPVPETAPLGAKNAYGASKLAGEVYCRLAAHRDLETVVLRLTNVYGSGDRDRVIPLFSAAAAAHQPITVFGIHKILDFVWIGTVVDALIGAGFGRYIRGPVNIGSGIGTSLDDLAERIVRLTRSSSRVCIEPEREDEVSRFVADTTRAQRILKLPKPEDPLWALGQVLPTPMPA